MNSSFAYGAFGLLAITSWWTVQQDSQEAKPTNGPVEIDAAGYSSLQAAVDALPAAGGIVRIPPGTFELTEPLVISTPETRLTGAGPATHLKNVNNKGLPAIHLRPDDYATNPRSRLWRIQLDNFRVSGNPASQDGILAEGINEIFIQGVSIDHHAGSGISLVDCYEDPRIANCIITYNAKAGLRIERGHDIVVNANHFEENQDAVVCTDSFNLCMNGNNLDDHLRHGVVIENTYGSVVSGNMIEECNGTAIILDRDCYGITLSANVIAHDMGGGIDLKDAHGCAVSANTFTLLHDFGVRVGPESGRITISANSFCNSHIGNGEVKRVLESDNPVQLDIGHGVVLEGASHVTITGNTFSGLDGAAVQGEGECEAILVMSNVMTDLHRRTEPQGNGNRPIQFNAERTGVFTDNLTDSTPR